MSVPPAPPWTSRIPPREIEVAPVSFNTIAFAALIFKSLLMAGLLDRICVKTVEKVEVTLPPPPLVGRGRPLKVTALMSPEQMVEGVKSCMLLEAFTSTFTLLRFRAFVAWTVIPPAATAGSAPL
jgi:hypothetical protein